jgi:serine/threonine protein kinase
LGDFGLATRHRAKKDSDQDLSEQSDAGNVYDAIEDISRLLGGSAHASLSHQSSIQESMTGGVGTTFYRAPEQEGLATKVKGHKHDSSYDSKADLFSMGIVLFEMFHPPFETVSTPSCLCVVVNLFHGLVPSYLVHGKSTNSCNTSGRPCGVIEDE